MIFLLWTISFIKSLNCFSHNYTYQRGIPSLYVSLRDERANFLAVINTYNSFSLFEGSRDVFGTYSQKIIDRKNINITNSFEVLSYKSEISVVDMYIKDYCFYISTEMMKNSFDKGLGFGYNYKENEEYHFVYTLYKQKLFDKFSFALENQNTDKGVIHFGSIPNNRHKKLPYKGYCNVDDNSKNWECDLLQIEFKGEVYPINKKAIFHSGIDTLFISQTMFNIMENHILQELLFHDVCIRRTSEKIVRYIECSSDIDYFVAPITFTINNMKFNITIKNLFMKISNGRVSKFMSRPEEPFNSSVVFGNAFIKLFNYTVFDYEEKQIELYSDFMKIEMKNQIDNKKEIVLIIYVLILIQCFINIFFLLYIIKYT